jgi:hypothetical protein
VSPNIDEIFREANALSLQIDQMPEGDPSWDSLLRKRDRLRARAQTLADSRRHPTSVENEIAMLEARRDEIDGLFITKGYAEKHLTKGFADPGAYSANINQQLAAEHASEIAQIDERLTALRKIDPPADKS